MKIDTIEELDGVLKNGPWTWPGGYPIYFVANDGASLSAVNVHQARVREAIRENADSGWRIVAADINWEDPQLYCDHTNKRIPSAYADDLE